MQKNSIEQQVKSMLLEVAKGAIYEKLYDKKVIDKNELVKKFPKFQNRAATFVTLNLNGKLRGCIGTLVAHNSLIDDLTTNAYKAAFEDPRFSPLSKEEFENIELEISLLSQAIEVKYENFKDLETKINKGIDGVIIRQENKQATFLPQVWEQLPDFEDFFTHLFHKAGITDIEKPIDVFVYNVQKIK